MANQRGGIGKWVPLLILIGAILAQPRATRAQDCTSLLGLFQAGRSSVEIARETGLTTNEVEGCRQQLRQPIFIGPAGAPPLGAAGPPPRRAAGPPPSGNAVGPPPIGAAGPPPVGREVKRLP